MLSVYYNKKLTKIASNIEDLLMSAKVVENIHTNDKKNLYMIQ